MDVQITEIRIALSVAACIGNDDVGGHLQLYAAEASRAGGVGQLRRLIRCLMDRFRLCRGLLATAPHCHDEHCGQRRRDESGSPHPASPINPTGFILPDSC